MAHGPRVPQGSAPVAEAAAKVEDDKEAHAAWSSVANQSSSGGFQLVMGVPQASVG